MNQFIPLLVGIVSVVIGVVLGYYARQSIARRDYDTLEAKIQKRISQAKTETGTLLAQAKEKASQILEKAKAEADARSEELFKTERLSLRRENILDEKLSDYEKKEAEFRQKVERLREIKGTLESLREKADENLEKISGFSKKEAREELFENLEKEYQKEGKFKFDFPEKEVDVELPRKFAEEFLPYSRRLGAIEGVYGFRHQKQFQVLSEAHALMHGRTTVNQEDVNEIKKLAEWINLDFKPI